MSEEEKMHALSHALFKVDYYLSNLTNSGHVPQSVSTPARVYELAAHEFITLGEQLQDPELVQYDLITLALDALAYANNYENCDEHACLYRVVVDLAHVINDASTSSALGELMIEHSQLHPADYRRGSLYRVALELFDGDEKTRVKQQMHKEAQEHPKLAAYFERCNF